jgi:hypothetical protein
MAATLQWVYISRIFCGKYEMALVRDYVDWIDLAEDRDHWRARVIMVMSFWAQKMLGNS